MYALTIDDETAVTFYSDTEEALQALEAAALRNLDLEERGLEHEEEDFEMDWVVLYEVRDGLLTSCPIFATAFYEVGKGKVRIVQLKN